MEAPYAPEYDNSYQRGTFICKHSDEPFFSKNNFNAVCGWPSFDRIFPKVITSLADTDGTRTEIQCASYIKHLGHVSLGEHLGDRVPRECATLLIRFIPDGEELPGTINEEE
jgi:peptide methionine sulfoxide reductase MsrB